MKVGLLDSRAPRLGGYWSAYLKELGVETVTPALPDTEALKLGQQSLPGESLSVQLVLGRILALGRVDAVLVPEWSPVQGDAWSEALTELLTRRISGLPTLIAVPDGGPQLENVAAEVGLRLSQNAGGVRLALERARPHAHLREEMPNLNRAGQATVAVVGPRALLGESWLLEPLRVRLEALGLHAVYSHELPLGDVMKRSERMEMANPPAGERELFGAVSLLGGKGAVKGFLLVSPARDGATGAALERLAARQHKPTLHLSLDTAAQDWPELEAFRDRVTLGATPGTTAAGTTAGESGA